MQILSDIIYDLDNIEDFIKASYSSMDISKRCGDELIRLIREVKEKALKK